MQASNRTINIALAVITAIAILGMFSGSNEPIIDFLKGTKAEGILYSLHTGNEIIFSLSGGFLVSLFLWFLVVKLPASRKRKILKNNLAKQYQHFREDTVAILLCASGSYNYELQQRLCDYQEFKRYFNENNKSEWYAVLNGLQGNKGHLNDLLVEIELLANEIHYILNNIDIDDDKVHSFLKNLSTHLYRLKNTSVYTDENVRPLGNFVWEIFAQWSLIDGQRKEDIVQKMIDQI
ncbi:MAG TPA: hypothetical protein ENH82_19655 [bacterium]|nr:hypothetical protein [bacterium]